MIETLTNLWFSILRPILLVPVLLALPYMITRWAMRWLTGWTDMEWWAPILTISVIIIMLFVLWFFGSLAGCLLGWEVEGICVAAS